LKREVRRIVPRGGFATTGYAGRLCWYVAFYAYCQYQWIRFGSTIPLAVAYGIGKAFVGLNVQHDANHGSISATRPWLNRLLGMFADGIGGSQWLWTQQHWTHHAHTNHSSKDPDANAGRPFLRLHLEQPSRPWYRFQAAYAALVFSLYWLAEVWNMNVLNVQAYGVFARDVGAQKSGFLHQQRYGTVLLRILYIAIHFGLPVYYHGPVVGLSHCLILGATGSLILSGLFTMSHNFVGVNRHPQRSLSSRPPQDGDDYANHHDENDDDNDADNNDGNDGKQQLCWYRVQVESSCTYGGALAGYLTGGLNYQIEHHLFPRLNSAWYPSIAPTVRDVCRRHGVRYTYFPSLLHNLASTVAYLDQTGCGAGTTTTTSATTCTTEKVDQHHSSTVST
jgi:acyl-lipid (7-3)-desaturase (Delta-4 desaturase)